MTYSPKVFIPLTMLCRDRCGYCTFAKAPARLASPYLSPDEVLAIARAGAAAGCAEALFTLGERPELRYPSAAGLAGRARLRRRRSTTWPPCAAVVLDETGLLPHANAGALDADELASLRPVAASQGMMIETLADDLDAHRSAPDKTPARRLATLEAAGELAIPFTTGILVGIGETRARPDRGAGGHRRVPPPARARPRGHRPELPAQAAAPRWPRSRACPPDELRWAIAAARLILPDDVHVQAPPNLSEDLAPLLAAGIDDWGGVSPVTIDHVNPERAWPALERLESVTEAAGFTLAPRLTIYPSFALAPERWLDPAVRFGVLALSDAEGLARDAAWCSGGEVAPPELLETSPVGRVPMATPSAQSPVAEILAGRARSARRWARTRS